MFIYKWLKARAQASRGNDLLARTMYEALSPPDDCASICLAQRADIEFRLYQYVSADHLYSQAISREQGFDRQSGENKAYIVAYCQYYKNAIAKMQGQEEPIFPAKDIEESFYNPMVSDRLKTYTLALP